MPCTIKGSDNKTLVSPLSGCFQNSCFLTTITNSKYTLGVTEWLANGSGALLGQGGLAELEAAYSLAPGPARDAAGAAALDALKSAVASSISSATNVSIRSRLRSKVYSAVSDLKNTSFDLDLTEVIAGAAPFDEKPFQIITTLSPFFKDFLARAHASDSIIIDIFVQLTADPTVNCTTVCGGVNPITPTPSTDCGPDDSSSEDCGNRYGYNFPFFQPCASNASWAPLK